MKKLSFGLAFWFCGLTMSFASPQQLADSLPPVKTAEDKIIDEILESRKAPAEEKVQYLSMSTQYGLKSLFRNTTYTPGLSYNAQVHPSAQGFMENYIRNYGKFLMGMKSWGQPYFTLIENIFSRYGVPHELKYLAVIESNLKTSATSWVGAGGPWQFMPYTAKDYGLEVSKYNDERRDYYKSTDAAARYLLDLYRQMNRDWLLVIAAYNGGPGRVYSAMNKSGSKNFWDLQYYLPEESRNHVKKFIATHYLMEGTMSSGDFAGTNAATGAGIVGIDKTTSYVVPASAAKPYYAGNKPVLNDEEAAAVTTLTVSGKYNAATIVKYIDMDRGEFNRLNPNFDNTLSQYGRYDMRLPHLKMNEFQAKKYDILNECVKSILNSEVRYSNETIYKKKRKAY